MKIPRLNGGLANNQGPSRSMTRPLDPMVSRRDFLRAAVTVGEILASISVVTKVALISGCGDPELPVYPYHPTIAWEKDEPLDIGVVAQGKRAYALSNPSPLLIYFQVPPVSPKTGKPYQEIAVIVRTKNGQLGYPGVNGFVNVETGGTVPLKVWWENFGPEALQSLIEAGNPKGLKDPYWRRDWAWVLDEEYVDEEGYTPLGTALIAWDKHQSRPGEGGFFDLSLINTVDPQLPAYFPLSIHMAVAAEGVDVIPGFYDVAYNVAIRGTTLD